MIYHFTNQSVARNDIPFDNFTQVVKGITANYKLASNCSSWLFFYLLDVNVYQILGSFPEFPCEGYVVFTSGLWSKDEVSYFTLEELQRSFP
jgi:hypothetical protein